MLAVRLIWLRGLPDLFKSFIIDKACSVLRYVELPFLQILAELPESRDRCQASKGLVRNVGSA